MASCEPSGSRATGAVEFRKKEFKKKVGSGRAKRAETRIQLRRNKRQMGLAKRRNIGRKEAEPTADASGTEGKTEDATSSLAQGRKPCTLVPNEVSLEHLDTFVEAAQSDNEQAVTEGVRMIRRLLSKEEDPPVEEIVETGILSQFATYLTAEYASSPALQFEAAWALTNIASTEHTEVVVELGVTPSLVDLLMSQDADVREQSLWALGNIAGDGHKYRDMVLSIPSAVENLVTNIAHPHTLSLMRNAVWTLSNYCRGKPQPSMEATKPILEVLTTLLGNTDTEVLTDTCWAFSYLSDGSDERIQSVLDCEIVGRMIELLGHSSTAVVTPALRTVGNFVSGADHQTQAVIENGGVEALVELLGAGKRNIRKEACWAISNMAAGSKDQVECLTSVEDLVPRLVHLVANAEWSVKKEAAWAISNLLTTGSPGLVAQMIDCKVVLPMCNLLKVEDVRIVLVGLDALDCILRAGAVDGQTERYCEIVEESGGLDTIELLQEHRDNNVANKAVNMIEMHFGVDETLDDENLTPANGDNTTFGFGVSATSMTTAPGLPKPGFSFGSSKTTNFASGFGSSSNSGGFSFNARA